MTPKELRIGNLVSNLGQYCFVMNIYKDNKVELGYFEDSIGFVRSLDDIDVKPIPLKEEWLLNFGFAKDGLDFFYSLGQFIVRHDFVLSDIDIRVEIKYVHQLQNLYFALTGEELTLKYEHLKPLPQMP